MANTVYRLDLPIYDSADVIAFRFLFRLCDEPSSFAVVFNAAHRGRLHSAALSASDPTVMRAGRDRLGYCQAVVGRRAPRSVLDREKGGQAWLAFASESCEEAGCLVVQHKGQDTHTQHIESRRQEDNGRRARLTHFQRRDSRKRSSRNSSAPLNSRPVCLTLGSNDHGLSKLFFFSLGRFLLYTNSWVLVVLFVSSKNSRRS